MDKIIEKDIKSDINDEIVDEKENNVECKSNSPNESIDIGTNNNECQTNKIESMKVNLLFDIYKIFFLLMNSTNEYSILLILLLQVNFSNIYYFVLSHYFIHLINKFYIYGD